MVLAITGIVLQRRSDRLRPPPKPASLASRVPRHTAAASVATTKPAPTEEFDPVRLVIIEPLSVLYAQTQVLDQELLPFIRKQGGSARADTIADGYRSLMAGSTETAAFWELCGVHGPPEFLDVEFVKLRQLHRGVGEFLDEMQRRRIPVAATTNDAAAWSKLVRERDRLSVVWPWLVSSQVGIQASDVGMFEVLRRESGISHRHCLYIGADLDSLDAAKDLGMKTALFDTGDLDLPAVVGHPIVKNFKGLVGSK